MVCQILSLWRSVEPLFPRRFCRLTCFWLYIRSRHPYAYHLPVACPRLRSSGCISGCLTRVAVNCSGGLTRIATALSVHRSTASSSVISAPCPPLCPPLCPSALPVALAVIRPVHQRLALDVVEARRAARGRRAGGAARAGEGS